MKIPFSKYHGAGNDFVMIDNTSAIFSAYKLPVKSICHRRFGIGADGLILLESSKEFDFKMLYFNSDGNPGTMCGNGGRSTVAFAHRLKLIGATTTFLASDGPHTASIDQDSGKIKLISLGMSPVTFGIMLTMNLAIGFCTPPYGINLFVASAISKVSMEDMSKQIMKMILALVIVLMLITFVPFITTMFL